jgi:hypothetical protein
MTTRVERLQRVKFVFVPFAVILCHNFGCLKNSLLKEKREEEEVKLDWIGLEWETRGERERERKKERERDWGWWGKKSKKERKKEREGRKEGREEGTEKPTQVTITKEEWGEQILLSLFRHLRETWSSFVSPSKIVSRGTRRRSCVTFAAAVGRNMFGLARETIAPASEFVFRVRSRHFKERKKGLRKIESSEVKWSEVKWSEVKWSEVRLAPIPSSIPLSFRQVCVGGDRAHHEVERRVNGAKWVEKRKHWSFCRDEQSNGLSRLSCPGIMIRPNGVGCGRGVGLDVKGQQFILRTLQIRLNAHDRLNINSNEVQLSNNC